MITLIKVLIKLSKARLKFSGDILIYHSAKVCKVLSNTCKQPTNKDTVYGPKFKISWGSTPRIHIRMSDIAWNKKAWTSGVQSRLPVTNRMIYHVVDIINSKKFIMGAVGIINVGQVRLWCILKLIQQRLVLE